MMMMNSTIIINYRTHVVKPPHNYFKNTNYSLPNNNMMMNKKSAVLPPLLCLKKHCEINTCDNVFNKTADDNEFTAELDLTDMYAFTSRRVLRVFTYGVGSKFKLGLANDSGMDDIIGMDLVGRIEDVEMRRTFNMKIGMILAINKETVSRILQDSCCKHVYLIGEVVSGDGVTYQLRMA